MDSKTTGLIMQNKIFLWIAAATGLILLIPLVAMQFTSEVDWQVNDFMIMGILLFGMGFMFVHIARVAPRKYRTLIAIACVIALLLIWVHLAVGIVDSWPLAGS